MNPNDNSANKAYMIKTNGVHLIPISTNPNGVRRLFLSHIVVQTKGGSGNTCEIYDSNEVTKDDVTLQKGILDTTDRVGQVLQGFGFSNGIYLKVGGGTAPNLTIVYKEFP